jgi:thioredoxin-dependent peroxiredoxin
MSVDVGDKAPAFKMATDDDGEISLAARKGRPVVLYFYPKDDTPGCTKEACGFQAALPDFSRLDADVIGVSKDSVTRHKNFKSKYGLNFTLGSDADGSVCESYGVWKEKKNYGRTYMGIERSTFLIDGKGVIRNVWRKVKVNGHVDEVLEAAKAL